VRVGAAFNTLTHVFLIHGPKQRRRDHVRRGVPVKHKGRGVRNGRARVALRRGKPARLSNALWYHRKTRVSPFFFLFPWPSLLFLFPWPFLSPDIVNDARECRGVVAVRHLVRVGTLQLLVVAEADGLKELLVVVALEVAVRRRKLRAQSKTGGRRCH
jgi:hypothetical protein